MKSIIIISLSILCLLLASTTFFLWIYNSFGFEFTVKCIGAWSLSLAFYTIVLGLIFGLIDEVV